MWAHTPKFPIYWASGRAVFQTARNYLLWLQDTTAHEHGASVVASLLVLAILSKLSWVASLQGRASRFRLLEGRSQAHYSSLTAGEKRMARCLPASRPQLIVFVRFAHFATAFEYFGCAHARTIRAHARALWACSLIAVANSLGLIAKMLRFQM